MRTGTHPRRRFLVGIAGIAAAARVRAERVYRLGVLFADRDSWDEGRVMTRELAKAGFVEGRNLILVERYFAPLGGMDAAPALARELAAAKVDAVLTAGTPLTRMMLEATTTIPIVTNLLDPVASGLVRSLSLPGRNVTGLAFLPDASAAKDVDVARAWVPKLRQFVFFVERNVADISVPPFERVAARASLKLTVVEGDAETFRSWIRGSDGARDRVGFVGSDLESDEIASEMATLAIERRLPLLGSSRRGVQLGQLSAYGEDIRDARAVKARMTAAVLRGADPARIPFELPSAEYLVINRSTARKLGMAIPDSLRLMASEIID